MKDGKLFGKINIIDLLVLILAIVIVVAVGLKMTGRLGAAVTEVGTNITYTAKVEGVELQIYEEIKTFIEEAKAKGYAGDQLMSNGALLPAYVTGVTATPHEATVFIDAGGGITVPLQRDTVDLVFTVEAYVPNNIKTELGSQEIRVGKPHIVKTTHFELTYGVIRTCSWEIGTGADNA